MVILLSTAAGAGSSRACRRPRTTRRAGCPAAAPPGAFGISACVALVGGAFLFHLLHPFDRALVGAREDGFNRAQLGAKLQLSPREVAQVELADLAQPELRPDARRRLGNDRVHQRGHDAQRFG